MLRNAWILYLVAMTASASAQPAPEQAEVLFREGKELMTQKKFAEACAAFERSQQLDPRVSTLLNHADCREKNGQLVTAWGLFRDAKHQTRAETDAAATQRHGVAAARADKLEPRLSKLSIDIAPGRQLAGLEILRGANRVEPDAWNHALPIDGGTYQITARAPGHVEWSTSVVVKPEGDKQVIEVPKLEPVPAPPAPAAPTEIRPDIPEPQLRPNVPEPQPRPDVPEPQPRPDVPEPQLRGTSPSLTDRGSRRSLTLPLVMGGAALVLGGSAFAFSRWGDSVYDDAEREPDDAKQEALWKAANKRRYAAIGFAAGAAGCVGAAIYLYVRGGRETTQPVARRSIRVEPAADASAMGLTLAGDW